VQRIFFSTGHTPDVFWQSTFDEVLLIIKGKIDDMRFQRLCAWKIVEGFRGSKDMPELINFCPLPYDDEIVKQEKKEQVDSFEFYKESMAYLDTIIWKKP
jgi:hypothetical protein